jgi:hypothetical protein
MEGNGKKFLVEKVPWCWKGKERKGREGKGVERKGRDGMDLSYTRFGHRKCDPRNKILWVRLYKLREKFQILAALERHIMSIPAES